MSTVRLTESEVGGAPWFQQLDPRTKLAASLVLATALLLVRPLWTLGVAALLVAGLVRLAKLPASLLRRLLRPVVLLAAGTAVYHALVTPGLVVAALGPVAVTAEGIERGAYFALRLVLLVTVAGLLALTTSPTRMAAGLSRLLQPLHRLGLPGTELAVMMTVGLRFMPLLVEEAERIRRAQTARGARFHRGGGWARLRGLQPLVVPLLAGAFRRAERLADAMEARGFQTGRPRGSLRPLKFSRADHVVWLVLLLIAVATGFLA